MVLAISAILVVGLSTVIEVPRLMVEERESGMSVSAADRFLSILGRDVRYSKDAEVPDPTSLRVTRDDGGVVEYKWSGSAGDPIVRKSPEGDSDVLGQVEAVGFALKMKSEAVLGGGGTLATQDVEVAKFESFTLQPPYQVAVQGVASGSKPVSIQSTAFAVSDAVRVGLWVTASGLDDGDGSIASIRIRARRAGTEDLLVRVFEGKEKALSEGKAKKLEPDRLKLCATGKVPNPALPTSFQDVTVPLTGSIKIKHNRTYFVELSAGGALAAAEWELLTLSDPNAAADPFGALQSTDGGANYDPAGGALGAGQVPFSLHAVKADVSGIQASPLVTVQTPVAVVVKIQLATSDGSRSLEASFPLLNHLAGM